MIRFIHRLVLLALGAFMLASIVLVVAGLNDKPGQAQLIVVPGNTIAPDGTPSPRLQARLDVASRLFKKGRAPRIFVSGGTGKEGFDEAASMAAYLQRQGVPAAAIIEDNQGWTTGATAANAAAYLRAQGQTTALVATQYFHVPRFELAMARQGVNVAGHAHAPYFELRDLYSIPRETVAYLLYYFRG